MSKVLYKIKLNELVKIIVATLLNKFDFFIVIEGGTGTGKSTLAVHIARGVRAEFNRLYALKVPNVEYYYERVIKKQGVTIEEFVEQLLEWKAKGYYKYNPYTDLIYDSKSMINSCASWHRIFVPDEFINVVFNRDFQSEDSKKIIKLINMYRDHRNLIISSVPLFNTLDVQIKNLCKMRISIARRGIGVIQTPNKIIYAKDKWDSANNEKIERQWLMRGVNKPKYNLLTTARGTVTFPKLPKKIELQYQEIKNQKRSQIVEKDFGIKKESDKEPIDIIYDELVNKRIRNSSQLEGYALAYKLDAGSIKEKLRRMLMKNMVGTGVAELFWEKKGRKAFNEDEIVNIQ